jgi:hypothetical protein
MKKQILALTTLTVAAALQLNAADVTGKITLKGTPPAAPSIDAIKTDPNCGKFYTEVPKMKFFVVGAGGELADAVVTLKGDGLAGKSTGESAAPVLLDQVKCEYVPYVTAVQTKQKISVRNSDPVMHNVHPIPSVSGNKEANKAQMPKAADIDFVFEKPEDFLKFKCDVHSWMFSYITVVDHPYFAVSGKDGTFTIKNVPDGKYTLEAVHRKGGKASKEIEVKGGNVTQDLTIELK